MEHKYNRWIMGTAVGIVAIAAMIDHTRHTLPTAQPNDIVIIDDETDASPCSLDVSPCSLD
ncbi:MAG: hypothetical protein KAT25_03490 [Sulfuriflexus sp.]|nr:hypothetical protein [Sulfuriflexus sp.]